jgi:hypothetical protein
MAILWTLWTKAMSPARLWLNDSRTSWTRHLEICGYHPIGITSFLWNKSCLKPSLLLVVAASADQRLNGLK